LEGPPLPFARLLDPFLQTACHLLEEAPPAGCLRGLAEDLARLAGPAFYHEFAAARACFVPLSAEVGPGDAFYRRFCRQMLEGGLEDLVRRLPVLGRLLATRVELWARATAEMLARLRADRPRLERLFGSLGPLEAARPCSDSHQGGRRVHLLRFASGLRLVYKPRDITLEAAWWRFLESLEAPWAPRPLLHLPGPGYGWVEAVPAREGRPCSRRAGALLALVQALGGVDFHQENLIWREGEPVPVDLETLLHPPLALPASCAALQQARALLEGSVLGTGLLPGAPVQTFQPGESRPDTSGLGGVGGWGALKPAWEALNQDAMRLVGWRRAGGLQGSRPLEAEAVVEGYRTMHRRLAGRALPTEEMVAAPRRFLFRTTWFYEMLMPILTSPRALVDGAEWSLEAARLYRYPGNAPCPARGWQLVESEMEALLEGDVPRFATRGRRGDLVDGRGRRWPGWLADSGARPRARPAEAETIWIRAALYQDGPCLEGRLPATPLADPLASAHQIAEALAATALEAEDGSATWLSLEHQPRSQRYEVRWLEPGLHRGACGVALFLAALARVGGQRRWARLALATLEPVRRDLERPEGLFAEWGPGGTMGLGSVVWSLVHLAELLDRPDLLDLALRAAGPLARPGPQSCDLTLGWAGALCALLTLHRATGQAAVLEQAVSLGRHLVAARRPTPSGLRAWGSPALTGMAHGAAGIAMALLRLHQAAPEPTLREAALEALAWEDEHFCPERADWADLRRVPPDYSARWCHGSAGVVLARLASPGLGPDRRLERAARALAASPLAGVDHYCCGEAGRIEALEAASRALGQEDLEQAAEQRLGRLEEARRRGRLRLYRGELASPVNPSLLRGLAGVGYCFLRRACPGLPCALTLSPESPRASARSR
jgi:lantibiotic modifying enzyme